jgi:hypothetical protein
MKGNLCRPRRRRWPRDADTAYQAANGTDPATAESTDAVGDSADEADAGTVPNEVDDGRQDRHRD